MRIASEDVDLLLIRELFLAQTGLVFSGLNYAFEHYGNEYLVLDLVSAVNLLKPYRVLLIHLYLLAYRFGVFLHEY